LVQLYSQARGFLFNAATTRRAPVEVFYPPPYVSLSSISIYITTDGQSGSLSFYQATMWDLRPIFLSLRGYYLQHLRFLLYWTPNLTRGRVCNLLVQVLLGIAGAVNLGSSPIELETISLSVASYSSHGYGITFSVVARQTNISTELFLTTVVVLLHRR
jgi:hypothetical protein